jgi:hypothetical protein
LLGVTLPKLVVYSLAILAILIIMGGYVGWTLVKSHEPTIALPTLTPEPTVPQNQTSPTDNASNETSPDDDASPTPDSLIPVLEQVEQARNDALMYLETTHPEVAFLFIGNEWQGGLSSGNQATQRYDYYAAGWNVTVEFSSLINPAFSITIKYLGDWQVSWQGTDVNATVNELSFSSNIPQTTTIAQ